MKPPPSPTRKSANTTTNMDSLSRLALILVLLIIFFAVLTQRIMLSSTDSTNKDSMPNAMGISGRNSSNSFSPISEEIHAATHRTSMVESLRGTFDAFSSASSIPEQYDAHSSPEFKKLATVVDKLIAVAPLPDAEKLSLSSSLDQILRPQAEVEEMPKVVNLEAIIAPPENNEVLNNIQLSEPTSRRRRRRKRHVDEFDSREPLFGNNSFDSTTVDTHDKKARRKRLKEMLQQQLIDLEKEEREEDLQRQHLAASSEADESVLAGNASVDYALGNVQYEYHPPYSPRPGSDISESQQLALLKCHNQSRCIVPELQLKVKLKIYLCKHPTKQGVRFYFLAREAFILHPNVIMLDESEMDTADFIIYLPGSSPWHLTECTNMSHISKLIVLDEFDGFTQFHPMSTIEQMREVYGPRLRWYYMYFKRSFVARLDGKFLRYPHLDYPDVYPMTYALAEAYLPNTFNFAREIEILCTLRGSAKMTTRQRVQDWVSEYATSRSVENVITAQVTTDSRQSVSKVYFQRMYNSKIIVTVNPANWEGDFRLWEAFATGALIMVDPIFVPHGFPLLDGVHVVYFSNQNKEQLFEKLDYYRSNPLEARKIAVAGYLHTMKYHRTVNLADYILRSAHLKRATLKLNPTPDYVYTAQYLNLETLRQRDLIKGLDAPGNYSPVVLEKKQIERFHGVIL